MTFFKCECRECYELFDEKDCVLAVNQTIGGLNATTVICKNCFLDELKSELYRKENTHPEKSWTLSGKEIELEKKRLADQIKYLKTMIKKFEGKK